jgi:trimethylamine:corrinoid methyltransferase-like protein
MVSGGRIFSYEEMALAVDILTRARTIARGIDVSAIGGSAGGAASPSAGPALIADEPHRCWSVGGRQTALDRAHERVARVAAGHRPPALDAALDTELRRLAGIG